MRLANETVDRVLSTPGAQEGEAVTAEEARLLEDAMSAYREAESATVRTAKVVGTLARHYYQSGDQVVARSYYIFLQDLLEVHPTWAQGDPRLAALGAEADMVITSMDESQRTMADMQSDDAVKRKPLKLTAGINLNVMFKHLETTARAGRLAEGIKIAEALEERLRPRGPSYMLLETLWWQGYTLAEIGYSGRVRLEASDPDPQP